MPKRGVSLDIHAMIQDDNFMRRFTAFLLIGLFLIPGCASSGKNARPVSSNAPASPALSKSVAEEVAIGKQIHAAILSQFYPYTDPKVVNYINQLAERFASHAGRKLPYRFTLLYSDKIYATSAPGGFIYLTTGLLYFLENEAQLAAVMAHEIGELQFQDRRLSRSRKILDAVTKGGNMLAPAFGDIGALALLGLVAVNVVADRKILNPEEKLVKADKLALHYMLASGYDPEGLRDFLYKFLSAKNEVIPLFLDYAKSRPITQERIESLQREFLKLPFQDKTLTMNRKEYQEMMTGVAEIYQR